MPFDIGLAEKKIAAGKTRPFDIGAAAAQLEPRTAVEVREKTPLKIMSPRPPIGERLMADLKTNNPRAALAALVMPLINKIEGLGEDVQTIPHAPAPTIPAGEYLPAHQEWQQSSPLAKFLNEMYFTGARAATALPSMGAGLVKPLLVNVESGEGTYRDQIAGLWEMVKNAPLQAQYLLSSAVGMGPSAGEIKAMGPDYQEAVESQYEAPESPGYALGMIKGGGSGLAKRIKAARRPLKGGPTVYTPEEIAKLRQKPGVAIAEADMLQQDKFDIAKADYEAAKARMGAVEPTIPPERLALPAPEQGVDFTMRERRPGEVFPGERPALPAPDMAYGEGFTMAEQPREGIKTPKGKKQPAQYGFSRTEGPKQPQVEIPDYLKERLALPEPPYEYGPDGQFIMREPTPADGKLARRGKRKLTQKEFRPEEKVIDEVQVGPETPPIPEKPVTSPVESKQGLKTIYHGTDKEFDKFDLSKTADGTIWFTDNKSMIENGEVAATGKGKIIERQIDEKKLKLGGWAESDKYSTDELINMGYDGLKLPDEGETTYQIFNPDKLSTTKPQPAKLVIGGEGKKIQEFMEENKAATGKESLQVEPAKTKEPWEMTREEYGKSPIIGQQIKFFDYKRGGRLSNWGVILKIEGDTYKIYSANNPKGYKYRNEKITDVNNWLAEGKLFTDIKERDIPTNSLFDVKKTSYHKKQVELAISSGKPVPPEVLAEYPDLAPLKESQSAPAPLKETGASFNEIGINELSVGDIVFPKERYYNTEGSYHMPNEEWEVLRVNPKTITVKTKYGEKRIPMKTTGAGSMGGGQKPIEARFFKQLRAESKVERAAKKPPEALMAVAAGTGLQMDDDGKLKFMGTPEMLGAIALAAMAGKGRMAEILKKREAARETTGEKLARVMSKRKTERTVKAKPVADTEPIATPEEAIKSASVSDLKEAPKQPFEWLDKSMEKAKDIASITIGWRDFYRNTRRALGADAEPLLNKFDDAKAANIEFQKQRIDEYKKEIEGRLKIKVHSKEDRAVMDFGEGKATTDDLVKKFGERRAADIIEGAAWYRKKYEAFLSQINEQRQKLWPNDESKLIPRRKDYFRHYWELAGIEGLVKTFETPAQIPSELVVTSEFTKPKGKFLSIAQRRLGDKSRRSAGAGYANYVRQASYAMHIDPMIAEFRQLEKALREKTGTDAEFGIQGQLNNYLRHLVTFTNDLAGKTNPVERLIQDYMFGRKSIRVLDWFNRRAKANVILANAGSVVAQIFNLPQAIGEAKIYAVPGIGDTFAQIVKGDLGIQKNSRFLKERYHDSIYWHFDHGIIKKSANAAAWLMTATDEIATRTTWNMMYRKALAEKIADPIRWADNKTRDMVGGRGIGEVPVFQKSAIVQMIAPFQLEVGNLWWVMREWAGEKAFGKFATYAVASWLFNQAARQIRGTPVSFDPLQATIEGIQQLANDKEDVSERILRAGGRMAGEVFGNIPLGQTVAQLYPEYGITLAGRKMPTRKQLYGTNDPSRYGSGILVMRGLSDPLYKILPPFGGAQAKKTVEGVSAYQEGTVRNRAGKRLYRVPRTPARAAQTAVFGKYSTPEAREYFENQANK